jgi:hypothetical protein
MVELFELPELLGILLLVPVVVMLLSVSISVSPLIVKECSAFFNPKLIVVGQRA